MANDWSAPERDVLARAGELLERDADAVLATVVDVEGSAYRRPGAKMLVTPEGTVGSVTAGCLADDVRAVAEEVQADGRRRIETYDLRADDDVWGLGVGCEGVVDLLLEPLDASLGPAVDAHEGGGPVAVLTVLDGDLAGERGYYRESIGVRGLPDWLAEAAAGPTARLLAEESSETLAVAADGREARVFVDTVTAPPELVVLGSGHDVSPVVELAGANGFETTVVGFRGAVRLAERFPAADRTVTTSPADVTDAVTPDDTTYVMAMTHSFVDDRLAVEALLDTPVPYVGILGPRERFAELREAFSEAGRPLSPDDSARIYAPAGIDLGGGSPARVATSVVAEVLAVHADREPAHLVDREGPIHDRVALGGDAASRAGDDGLDS